MAPENPAKTPASKSQDERKARLAEALRANLKRRKSQARERRDDDPVDRANDDRGPD